jgi:hypothetical protein
MLFAYQKTGGHIQDECDLFYLALWSVMKKQKVIRLNAAEL